MKKRILQLAVLLFLSVGAMARPVVNAINISAQNHGLLSVVFDGTAFSNQTSNFRLENVAPGNHYIKISAAPVYGWSRNRVSRVLYKGWVNVNPGEEVFAVVNGYNNLQISRMAICVTPPVIPPCHDDPYGYQQPSGFDDNCQPDHYVGYTAMSPTDFMMLKQSVLHANFESTRLETAKMALANNYLTSQQVASIMNLFWFESTKLDFAKAAYNHVVDPQNYFQVNNEFSFDSSVSELSHYLAAR